MAVAADQRGRCQAFLERGQRCAGASFLHKAERGIEQEQSADQAGFDRFAEPELKHDGGF
ncbi:MAG: hypothetical protein P8Y71_21010 [Pseudolabrys sp.]